MDALTQPDDAAIWTEKAERLLQKLEAGIHSEGQMRFSILPAIMLIGNQNPDLIVQHVKVLCSAPYLLSDDYQMANAVLGGFLEMLEANPAFYSIISHTARAPMEQVIKQTDGLQSGPWSGINKFCRKILTRITSGPTTPPRQTHISDNRPYDHFEMFARIILEAKTEFYFIDPYIGTDPSILFWLLRKVDGSAVPLRVLTRALQNTSDRAVLESAFKNFAAQGNTVALRYDSKPYRFHDRWCLIDCDVVYTIGTSMNYLPIAKSTKSFDIKKTEPKTELAKTSTDLEQWWQSAIPVI